MSARKHYDPDHCAACGDFLPCGDSWVAAPSPTIDLRAALAAVLGHEPPHVDPVWDGAPEPSAEWFADEHDAGRRPL